VENLEKEIDRLYALELAEFTAERDRLVRELRNADRRAEAAQVKQLRKPTLSAWTINQLARQERRAVDLLLAAGHRLREAQQGLVSGKEVGGFDEARRSEGAALAELRKAAARILAETGRGSEAVLDRIGQTLHAAAISSEGRELLARGRLRGDLEVTGFDLLMPLSEGQTSRPPRTRASKREAGGSASASSANKREQQRKQLQEARRLVRETRSNAKATAKTTRAAEQDAAKAREQLAQAEERLREAQAAAADAEAAAGLAAKELREVEGKTR
jgi:hypothetical protein